MRIFFPRERTTTKSLRTKPILLCDTGIRNKTHPHHGCNIRYRFRYERYTPKGAVRLTLLPKPKTPTSMRLVCLSAACAALFCLTACNHGHRSYKSEVVTLETLLDEMTDYASAAEFPEYSLRQTSSYDRPSVSPPPTPPPPPAAPYRPTSPDGSPTTTEAATNGSKRSTDTVKRCFSKPKGPVL